MRVRSYLNGGNSTGGFTFNGGTLSGILLLAGNPSELLEAAPKQYVDSLKANLNGNNVINGILPTSRLPSFAGDLVKPAGTGVIALAPTGVVAGDYFKPTVDAKGRVTSGGTLIAGDIPNFNWNKITSGKPTTAAGYGITDLLSTTGGTLTGFLTYNGAITGSMQAVTKQYIDTTLSSSSGIAIGDIIRKPFTTTPAGFLKCNGGMVDKTTYNSLYSMINDRFNKEMQIGAGQPWRQQYTINQIQDGDISNWSTSASMPGVLTTGRAIATKNRVYYLGGYNGSTYVGTVYTAPINSDGTLGAWATGTSLPSGLAHSSVVVTKNRVYLLGGSNAGVFSTVYTAPINSDGTLGAWATDASLPGALAYSTPLITKNRVYLLGGHTVSNGVSTVYTAPISSDGVIGTWTTGTSLPDVIYSTSLVVTKNRVYLCGGYSSISSALSAVYTAPINTDGTLGTWVASTSLPTTLYYAQAVVTKNRVYLIGGVVSGATSSAVYSAPINIDGTLGTWSTGTSIPGAFSDQQAIVTKNRVYLLGGYNGSAYSSTVLTATISGGLNDYSEYYKEDTANYTEAGNGKPWQLQYQINQTQTNDITGWTTTTSLPGILIYSSSIVTKNRIYLFGGNNNSGYVSTVYTAPINGDGTLGSWTTGTSLPIAMGFTSAIVIKDRVYLLGGYNGTASISTVYTAPINSDGTIGTWTTGPSLPGIRHNSQAILTKNRVYLISGSDATNGLSSTYTAPINIDGTLGTWTTGTSLPPAVYGAQVIVTKNRVYLLSGMQNGSFSAVVYTASINSDGLIGVWTTAPSLPGIMYGAQVIVTNNKVYLLAGQDSGSSTNRVYIATINADGTLGTWSTGTSLPGIRHWTQAVVTNSRVYLIGGYTNTGVSDIYMAPILGGLNDYSSYYANTFNDNYLMPGSGKPWEQQFQINTTQTASDLTGWTSGTSLPGPAGYNSAIVTKNRVYVLGGHTSTNGSSTVYTAPINTDGTIGAWVTSTALPTGVGDTQAIVTKNRVYLLGGGTSNSSTSIVQTAPINSDGTLGTWTTGPSLPGNLYASTALVTRNRVYTFGGYNGSADISTVYTAAINSDGTLGSWSNANNNLPVILESAQSIATKNRVYIIGGYSGGTVATVYTATIYPDGTLGSWSTSTSLPGGAYGASVLVVKNRVYVMGGVLSGGTAIASVYTAPINSDGTLGTWATGTSLPAGLYQSSPVVTKNRIYLLGGYNGGNVSTVYTTSILEGLNDYSPWYDGTILPATYVDPLAIVDTATMFALPDLTNTDKFDTISYIKY